MGLLVLGQLEREVFSFADSQYRSGYVVIRFRGGQDLNIPLDFGALRNWMSDSSKICIVLSQSAYLLITMRALSRFVSLSSVDFICVKLGDPRNHQPRLP